MPEKSKALDRRGTRHPTKRRIAGQRANTQICVSASAEGATHAPLAQLANTTLLAVAAGVLAALVSAATASAALLFLRNRQIVDLPNERSSHARPTLRGLGLGVVPVVLVAWLAIASSWPSCPRETVVLCVAAAFLGVLSWFDDIKSLPALPRLLAQATAVGVGMAFFEPPELFPPSWMPPSLNRATCALLWIGLINQINFADGIDGSLGALLACVGVGLFGVLLVANGPSAVGALALTLAGAAGGFLRLNWSPAKAFMGDVGSVPTGYLLGWLLLRVASYGQWAPALILPLFYFLDTAVTYSTMIVRRERFWNPHRKYVYQRAALRMSHARVVWTVMGCNAILLALGLAAAAGHRWLVVPALLIAIAVYVYLARVASSGPRSTKWVRTEDCSL